MESERTTLPSSWEKFKVVSGFLASILVPLAVGLAGHWVSAALTEKEVKMRYVELAIGILKEKPDEAAAGLREWAVKVLESYSPVPIPEEARKALRQKTLKASDTVRLFEQIGIQVRPGAPEVPPPPQPPTR